MKILIVDDDKDLLKFLHSSLKSRGFIVDSTENGKIGLSLTEKMDYDLIILDINLPGMNGCEICQKIRQQGKATPILMLTVSTEIDSKVELLNKGADDYLTKPFSFKELFARINALLRRPQNSVNKLLQIKDLILDEKKQKVTRSGKEIKLTPKEFQLLRYLMQKQGETVSRVEILEHIWDSEIDLWSKTLETHILNLRKKIDGNSSEKIIKTSFGRGYKIG